MIWTEELEATLIDLYHQKLSYAQIANAMKIKRNSVAGKLRRLKLPKRGDEKDKLDMVKDLYAKGWSFSNIESKLGVKINHDFRDRIKENAGSFSFRRPRVKIKKKLYFSKVVIPAIKTLDELGPNECRFPQGDGPYLFCGKETQHGSVYCPSCHATAYIPLYARGRGKA